MSTWGPRRWDGGKKSVQARSSSSEAAAEPIEEPEATDSAKALAGEHGIDLATVTGTGLHGKIVKDDVAALLGSDPEPPVEPEPEPVAEPDPEPEPAASSSDSPFGEPDLTDLVGD